MNRWAEVGIEGSVGRRGDASDDALADTVIGVLKTEVIYHGGPWRSVDDVEDATLEWVAWFNTTPLLEPRGNLPPAAFDAQQDAALTASAEPVLK